MEVKSKDGPKTKDLLKQLQADLRDLQVQVGSLRQDPPAPDLGNHKAAKTDAVVQYAVPPKNNGNGTAKTGLLAFSEAQLLRVEDEAVAVLGSALSSSQKVALLRALLACPAGENAAALGEQTSLSTGSLYHHLHDLMHAGLIAQTARNRYSLTERGRRVLLVVLALAAQP